MFSEVNELLSRPAEIIPDTHAIRKILPNSKVIEKIKEICHNFIIPDLKHEERYYRSFLQLMERLYETLRSKYKDNYKPNELPESLKQALNIHGAKGCDFTVVGVALRRRRKTNLRVIIVSNDPCFHNTPELYRQNIYPVYVNQLIQTLTQG